MKYAYDYQNMHTRGWVRGEFEVMPASTGWAAVMLEDVARSWPDGTDLRLVEIDDNGTETFPAVIGKGSRGPLPKDKKTS